MTPDSAQADHPGGSARKKFCALGGCREPVEPRSKPGGSPKRYCSERHQRIAAQRRYHARHTELAVCQRERCGRTFERVATSKKVKVYCSDRCMRLDRSKLYAVRPDIQAGIAKAREVQGGGRPALHLVGTALGDRSDGVRAEDRAPRGVA